MPHTEYDVDAAVGFLNDHATSQPHGHCAAFVRRALEAGGAVLSLSVADAKNYGPVLMASGFVQTSANEMFLPHKGDIAVIQPYQGGNTSGHIAMYNGTQWVSDFRQRDMWGGPGYRTNKPPYQLFRRQGDQ